MKVVAENATNEYHKLTNGQRFYVALKSIISVLIGIIGTLLLSPVFLIIIIAIKIEDGIKAPVLFKQERIGIDKKPFTLYKFRSMKISAPPDVPTYLLKNTDNYITKVGGFLRKTSLDELPQIWNMALGKLHLISYRPVIAKEAELIAERDKYGVYQLKPGLTGWAQIHGRDKIGDEEKASLDSYYIRNIGPILDMKCFFATIPYVLKGDGVVEGGTGEMNRMNNESIEAVEAEKLVG